ncbi:DUF3800 domain-containing protein [Tardiphaga sp. vice352]|uniref:DUF3800 domain-containing protein n=1 Tax=unclassified Tardiphaga TaxID=2631404 RepID=UPI00116408A1|nr:MULTISPECIES: DUF3800 domain-containing protein [unclassified Tardiphaga]QDM17449.1 DUF3800 domain-containing protein [Tardiphaga sp. vice278]QDM22417.1 DUF3800 domain-containing protein [Tardiphaga sp. vice154]QDM32846.1 DUF3800 domain-containing protein [Tardiphaga sp. vice352]
MHLLYLDDSGSVTNASDRHIVLAGLSVFERQPHWFAGKMDDIAKQFWPDNAENLEFRGSDILSGKKHWRGISKADRFKAYQEALGVLRVSNHVTIFGAAIHKAALSPNDPMEYAFEQLCNRFDRFLGRLHKAGDTQRGLIILDKSSYETSLQGLALNFRKSGHRWGQIYNLADVPMFVDSIATRLIQFADLIAHAIRRYFEKEDASLFDIIAPKFDTVGGVHTRTCSFRTARCQMQLPLLQATPNVLTWLPSPLTRRRV